MMNLGYSGSPAHGYDVDELIVSIETFLDASGAEPVVLVGIGSLGRAIMNYFSGRRLNLVLVAAFDSDPQKVNRTVSGCPCYGMDKFSHVVLERRVRVGILTVPASAAQGVADLMVRSGLRGILNFAPAPLRVSPNVYVEQMDMTMALEKVAFFARQASEVEVTQ
jgi:redox-sensing transcriptional repressor